MKLISVLLYPIIITISLFACSSQNKENESSRPDVSQEFKSYWYDGKAEITSYALEQARYGEIRKGTATMIFVTEDFIIDNHVKLDKPGQRPTTSVLKLNFIKRFQTGIYDYSLMTSTFTPISRNEYPYTLKVTNTNQDWCGQTYMQINRKKKDYRIMQYSYFESEADTSYNADCGMLEDELWNLIRLNPASLPVGEMKIIPGTVSSRLRHKNLDPVRVVFEKMQYNGDEFKGPATIYSMKYYSGERSLSIYFESAFPYRILGWDETYDDFGKMLTSKARKSKEIKTDYWKKNKNEFNMLHDSLFIK